MKVRDVCAVLDAWAPPGLAYEGDHVGLSIGAPDWHVSRLLVALTVTPRVVAMAKDVGAQMIVSHHAVLWRPLPALRADDPHTALCLGLAEARIACFAAHTNLDLAPGGVNDTLADLFELTSRAPLLRVPHDGQVKLVTFVPESHLAPLREALCEAGAGVIGDYTHCSFSSPGLGTFLPGDAANPFSGEKGLVNEEPERRFEVLVPKVRLVGVLDALMTAHPYDEPAYDLVCLENRDRQLGLGVRGELAEPLPLDAFAVKVRTALGLSHVRVFGDAEEPIKKVAVIGGGGGGEVGGVPDDIDVYVTGDVRYHDAVAAAERGVALIDAGHAGTERCIVPVLQRFLSEQLEGLYVDAYEEAEDLRVLAVSTTV